MIQTEKVTIRGTVYDRTYSDANMRIERDGVIYDEAIDPENSGRTYTETNIPIEVIE